MHNLIKFYEFNIKVIQKKVKYLRLKVFNNEEIILVLPLNTNQKEVTDFLMKNLIWLRTIVLKSSINNEVKFLGKSYKLQINKHSTKIIFDGDNIITPSKKELQKFFDSQAKEILTQTILHFLPFINRKINHISFKHMKTRWGSCNHSKAYINLNLALISKDIKFIEYVVLHELTHLIFAHHKKSFYDFIEKIMPDYKQRL